MLIVRRDTTKSNLLEEISEDEKLEIVLKQYLKEKYISLTLNINVVAKSSGLILLYYSINLTRAQSKKAYYKNTSGFRKLTARCEKRAI